MNTKDIKDITASREAIADEAKAKATEPVWPWAPPEVIVLRKLVVGQIKKSAKKTVSEGDLRFFWTGPMTIGYVTLNKAGDPDSQTSGMLSYSKEEGWSIVVGPAISEATALPLPGRPLNLNEAQKVSISRTYHMLFERAYHRHHIYR